MLAVKSMNVRDNFKDWCNQVINGETLIVSRPKNENVVILSEKEYNELQKAKRNAEYMAKINESLENHERGDTISFTMEELRAMESEDWKPSERILEFERKHEIQRNGEATK